MALHCVCFLIQSIFYSFQLNLLFSSEFVRLSILCCAYDRDLQPFFLGMFWSYLEMHIASSTGSVQAGAETNGFSFSSDVCPAFKR